MSTFVLVHGSWHNGSAWRATVRHLESKGHTVVAPTHAGHGKNADRRVNHAQCTMSLTDYVVARDLRDIVLVGHSFAGTVIAKVAEAVPDRIRRLVFWNAFALQDGHSLNDEIPPVCHLARGLHQQMPGSHEALFNNPALLAEKIIEAGRD
jgi:pimeloyl-ACP methyl ester carboxylesterase